MDNQEPKVTITSTLLGRYRKLELDTQQYNIDISKGINVNENNIKECVETIQNFFSNHYFDMEVGILKSDTYGGLRFSTIDISCNLILDKITILGNMYLVMEASPPRHTIPLYNSLIIDGDIMYSIQSEKYAIKFTLKK